MLLSEFQAITTRIAQNLSNQALITELLTQLNDDYALEETNRNNLSTQVTEQANQITGLQQTNMNLFLRVGNRPIESERLKTTEPMGYDDLLKDEFGVKE